MPYRSESQRRWAHATKQPWAGKWDEETKKAKKKGKLKKLPERVSKGNAWGHGGRVPVDAGNPGYKPWRTSDYHFNSFYLPLRAKMQQGKKLTAADFGFKPGDGRAVFRALGRAVAKNPRGPIIKSTTVSAFGVDHSFSVEKGVTRAIRSIPKIVREAPGNINSRLDRRAQTMAEILAPESARLGRNRQAYFGQPAIVEGGSKSKGIIRRIRDIGSREVDIPIHNTRSNNQIGRVKAKVYATGHVSVPEMVVDARHRNKGIGQSALGVLTERAKRSKTPGAYFAAAGHGKRPSWERKSVKMSGARAWTHGDARFVRGLPVYPPRYINTRRALKAAGQKEDLRNLDRNVARAAVGAVRPRDFEARLTPGARQAWGENENIWFGRAPGAKPYLQRTRYAVGGAGAGAAGIAVTRKDKKK